MVKRFIMGLVVALITTLFGLVGTAPASATDTTTLTPSTSQVDQAQEPDISYTTRKGVEVDAVQTRAASAASTADGGIGGHIEVTSESYSEVNQHLVWSNTVDLLINGAHQLAWWYPNHSFPITKRAIKRAPYIKVIYKPCSTQSASIAKQAHGASVVVAKPGSEICNTGRRGHITGGFKWTVKTPAILKWNKTLNLYQHTHSLVLPKSVKSDDVVVGYITFHGVRYAIVKTCGNRMGGHVDIWYDNVVQVHYEDDIKQHGELAGQTDAHSAIGLSVVCDSGSRFDVTAEADAHGEYSEEFDFSQRTKLDVEGANRVRLYEKSYGSMTASAKSSAKTSIKVDYFCAPTQEQTNVPGVSASSEACTVVGGLTPDAVTVTGKNNDDVTRTLVFSVTDSKVVTKTAERSVAVGQSVSVTFTGLALGNVTYSVMVKETGKSASGNITLQPCPEASMELSLDRPNDVDQSVAHPDTGEPIDWSFTEDTAHAVAPTGVGNVTYTVGATYGTVKFVTTNSPCEINGLRDNVVKTITKPSGTYDLKICYIASTEDPTTYGGKDTITLTAVMGGKTYKATPQYITVNKTPGIPG